MGPKKGGKKAEKPKEDEGKMAELRQQQQTLAKAELRRRMEDEAKISRVNSLKITNQWRKIMRIAKAEALKKDIEILSQNHERDVDRKDAILQMLDRDLEEAEDQYQMALRTHLVNLDTLIKLHDSRLYALERNFHHELKTLQIDFNKEKESMVGKFKQEKKELAAIIDAIETEEEGRDSEAKHQFEQLREEIRNKNLEEINMLRISLDAQIEDLEQLFETAHLNYLQQTAQRTHDFKELTHKDQILDVDINQKKKKIDNLQATIKHWRSKMRVLNRETEERNRLLQEEKNSIQRHYQQLKQRIKLYRSSQNQRLLHLSQSANACKKALNDKLEVARRVIQLNELSRKMETIQEQVLPFESPNLIEEGEAPQGSPAEATGSVAMLAKRGKPTATGVAPPPPHQSSSWMHDGATAVPPADRLTNFYRRYNKILLDNVAISKEKERLGLENAQLTDLIQQYVQGTQLSDDVLAEDNPLFVVNGRANLNFDPPVRRARPVVQDAGQISNTAARQTAW
mmetsp:Transcript_38/g.80  ORF Transcript_38/g.80 Transcript_38/m.80 type:complete len:514 (+) Transcript_38:199-1740(+)